MSEEPVVPQQGGSAGQPKGLLQQVEELMAAFNADLSALGEDLQSAGRGRVGADASVGVPPLDLRSV